MTQEPNRAPSPLEWLLDGAAPAYVLAMRLEWCRAHRAEVEAERGALRTSTEDGERRAALEREADAELATTDDAIERLIAALRQRAGGA